MAKTVVKLLHFVVADGTKTKVIARHYCKDAATCAAAHRTTVDFVVEAPRLPMSRIGVRDNAGTLEAFEIPITKPAAHPNAVDKSAAETRARELLRKLIDASITVPERDELTRMTLRLLLGPEPKPFVPE